MPSSLRPDATEAGPPGCEGGEDAFDLWLRGNLRAAFDRVLASNAFIMGREVEAFEAECAAYLGVDHALAVSSGTDALLLALMALGIGPGDEVICPTYSFFATAGSIWRVGAKPVFVDVDDHSFNVDPEAVRRAVTSRTRAISASWPCAVW